MPGRKDRLQIPPEVRESADRLAARRSLLGAVSYPFVVLVLGMAADLEKKTPYLFAFVLAAVLVLTAVHIHLARRFDRELWEGLMHAHLLRQARDELAGLVDQGAEELRKASLDYRRIFENAHDAILILEPEDEIVLNVNRRACEVYGFSREEFIGLSLERISENVPRGQRRLIQSSAASLLRLIDDILDFSKIEAGGMVVERARFHLRGTLREIVELLRFSASGHGNELSLTIGEGVPEWAWGDPGRLRQVLTNLLGNAVKFTERGTIAVEARRLPEGRLKFLVRDTGIGIPAEAQDRLFGLFSQADASTSRRFGGTGLGLAISRRIVEQMGGEIGFESEPGKGSTFWFALGLEPASPPEILDPARGRGARPRPGGRRRILVAEDNLINQIVVVQQLSSLGYDAVAVNNGQEALEALEKAPFDLILMDCQMPELDGYEATRRIREGPEERQRIPIVAFTAHARQEDLEHCLAAGMNDTITKPFAEEVLSRKLEHWLSQAGQGPGLPAYWQEALQVLDGERLTELRELGRSLGRDVLGDLVGTFESQAYVAEIRSALATGDWPRAGRRTHDLKGTSAVLGASRLVRLCDELEYVPRDAGTEAYSGPLEALEEECQRVLSALTEAAAEGR
ncbi:MAG: ATP-binding protein [Thermoanaerobaculia bacterium]